MIPLIRSLVGLVCGLLATNPGLSQELEWVRQAGSANDDGGVAIATDTEGNAYALMAGYGAVNVGDLSLTGGNGVSAILIKYRSNGETDWVRTFGGTQNVQLGGVAVDPSGYVYVAGAFAETASTGPAVSGQTNVVQLTAAGTSTVWNIFFDVFLLKYDLAGNLIWARNYGSAGSDSCQSIAVDSAGNIYLSGTYSGSTDLGSIQLAGSGLGHIWVARLNTEGQVTWANAAHTGYYAAASYKLGLDPLDGAVYLTGAYSQTIDFGSTQFSIRGGWDVFLAKYEATGGFAWARQGGGTGVDVGKSIVVDTNGFVYLGGTLGQASFQSPYSGSFDPIELSGPVPHFLVKYDSSGTVIWAINDGGDELAIDFAGQIYATGTLMVNRLFGNTLLSATGYLDLYAGKWDQSGNLLWVRQVGDLEQDNASDIAVDDRGNVFLIGSAYHSSSASNYQLTNYGIHDALVARLSSSTPLIVEQPQDQLIPPGSNAVFKVVVTDAGSASYQWLKNGGVLTQTNRITGTTTDTLRITAVNLDDEGDFSVRINTSQGPVLSALARLRLTGLMRFISSEKTGWGPFQATFTGPSGRLYDVEYSTNLVNWRFLTNGFAINGLMTVTDWSTSSNAARFYRAVSH